MLTHWIWLATRQGLNQRNKYELLRRFADPEDIYRDTGPGYGRISGKALDSLMDKSLTEAEGILNRCTQSGIQVIPFYDERYPSRLRSIPDPPVVLYAKGTLPDWEERPVIGAVGTRSCSDYGAQVARQLGYQLSRGGAYVASGMAQGIDAAVLEGAMAAKSPVLIFLAGGADRAYPYGNRHLYDYALKNGCVFSEQPPGVQAKSWDFPIRNRLISGVSNGVLVVEAPERSGALITARHALEQGREVFAVPGTILSESGKGSNALLRDGAVMALSGWDILEYYRPLYPQTVSREEGLPPSPQCPEFCQNIPGKPVSQAAGKEKYKKIIDNSPKPPYIDVETYQAENPAEQAILDALRRGPVLTDQLLTKAGLPYAQALSAITALELRGAIRRLPGNLTARNDN